jgi:hypothetical protein
MVTTTQPTQPTEGTLSVLTCLTRAANIIDGGGDWSMAFAYVDLAYSKGGGSQVLPILGKCRDEALTEWAVEQSRQRRGF